MGREEVSRSSGPPRRLNGLQFKCLPLRHRRLISMPHYYALPSIRDTPPLRDFVYNTQFAPIA
ncbi:hypothetical protein AZE42_03874 [Rhizopogon vesiculosus]|uniref:Uncharacterized protein n=1 Tax=Rhizopogon vesiculosus TaxID=180088 RepID=A0A1J8RCY3_9AGAM|nr:hypothetical protein AZE42_03874 [Rhizopogon vesiculosus]